MPVAGLAEKPLRFTLRGEGKDWKTREQGLNKWSLEPRATAPGCWQDRKQGKEWECGHVPEGMEQVLEEGWEKKGFVERKNEIRPRVEYKNWEKVQQTGKGWEDKLGKHGN